MQPHKGHNSLVSSTCFATRSDQPRGAMKRSHIYPCIVWTWPQPYLPNFTASPPRDRKFWTQGVACCLNGSVCSWNGGPLLLGWSLLEQSSGPEPLFSYHLPCGLNGFCLALFSGLAAAEWHFSLLLPMTSIDEVAVLCFICAHLERPNDHRELN